MKFKFKHFVSILGVVLYVHFLQAQTPEGYTWQEVHSVDFGEGVNHFTIEGASTGSGGEVELHLDGPDGKVIGRVFFHHTGSSDHYMNYECDLNQIVSGSRSVYMNFLDYEEPASGGVLNVGEFAFNQVEEPSNDNGNRLHVYQPVPGLDPSPYYTFEVQKLSDLNSPNLEEVSNWEEPFAFFTKCKDNDPDGNLGYYSKYIGGWSHTYCNVELDKNTPIVVKITRKSDCAPAPSGAIVSAAAHPAKKVDACEVINGAVYVTMSNPSQVSIDIDGQLDTRIAPRAIEGSWDDSAFPYRSEADGAHAVSIFANPFIDKPDINDPGVITVAPGSLPPEADGTWNTLYFLPGVHHFSMTADGIVRDWKVDDFYRLRSNINIYIPGDAFVYGNFTDDNDYKLTENVRIYGHGTICGTHMNHANYAELLDPNYDGSVKHARRLRMLHVTRSENVTFEGITVVDQPHHGCYVWGTDIEGPRNYVKWTKIIGWRVNSDGIHVSKNTVIEDCFLRCQDDGIYVAGQGIKRCVFWTDVNGIPLWCVVITGDRGADLQQDPLIVEDIDCIYGRGVFQTGAVINAYTAHDARIYPDGVVNTGQHVYFRNINYEDPLPRRRLISFDAREDQIEDWAGVRFENLTMQYPQINGLKDQLNGNENVSIKHFTFDNVTIDGVKVDAPYLNNPEVFETNNVEDITIRLRDTIPPTDYILTRTATNGTIKLETGTSGEVTVTADPLPGYTFDSWSGNLSGTNNPATITMDADKAITANFSLITYSISTTAENGTFILEPVYGPYLPGTEVTVTAVGDLGYGFESWGGDLSGTENPASIVMDGDKNISANFKEVDTYTLDITTEFGSVVLEPPGGEYNPNTAVTLSPEADPGYYFEQWMGDLEGSDNPATITMDADKMVNARFVYAGFGKTSRAINFGGSDYVATDGTNYTGNDSGSNYSTTASISGTEDDQLYQTERFGSYFSVDIPVDNGRYQVTLMFAEIFHSSAGNRVFNVSIEGAQVISNLDIFAKVGKNAAYNETHEVTVSDGEINIVFTTINNNAKISAIKIVSDVFEGDTYTLSTDVLANGIIEADPAEGPYPAGSNVLLSAIPDPGFMFSEWSGDLTGSENPVTLYMDGDKNISATFVETNWYTLTTSATNGTISLDPEEGIYGYTEGTEVTFTAIPDERYAFTGWSGDLSGTDNPATIVMDANKTVTANFVEITYYTLSTEAENGSISLDPPGGEYSEGTVVTLRADPDAGYIFKEWSGDITGSENPVTITMDSGKNVIAEFENPNALLLTINSTNGSVRVIPAQETYFRGASVILVATPDEGYEFAGWEGDLSGSDNPVGFVMDGNKNITAVFSEISTSADSFVKNPAQTILMQNFPNPFSTETTIQYQLSKASDVKLTVYNMMGAQVATLVDDHQPAGSHSVKWVSTDYKGDHLPNGLYIYRLETGNNDVLMKRAIIMK